jgi:single-strand DNA-binding protein
MSVNHHTAELRLRGNIGSVDIEETKGGTKVARVSVATDVGEWDSEAEEMDTRTEWTEVTFYGGPAKYIEQVADTGHMIMVTAKPETDSWDDADGNTQYRTDWVYNGNEMFVMDRDKGGEPSPEDKLDSDGSSGGSSSGSGSSTNEDPDDDLPF